MTTYPELFVLRHGQTEWNAAGRLQGQRDSPLTELGMAQARQQGRILGDAGAFAGDISCYCSPLGRTRATAELALPSDVTATEDPRIMEVGFGQWEGLTRRDIDDRWPGTLEIATDALDWHFLAEGGEDYPQFAARIGSFLDDLGGPAVVVTHGITSRVLRGLWLGLDRAGMAALPGGQGCVYHLRDGEHRHLQS